MKKIKLPNVIDPTYACESIGKIISVPMVPSLSNLEVKLAKTEIAKSISAIDDSLNIAYKRDSLDPDDPNYLKIDADWSRRARKMRKCLLVLYLALKEQEQGSTPTALEVEARHVVQKTRRRAARQALQMEAFLELLHDELGEDAVDNLIGKSAVIADDRVEQGRKPNFAFFDD